MSQPREHVNAFYDPHGAAPISGSLGACRVWVESINPERASAIVRPDAGEGTRGREYFVWLADLDFTREWRR